MSLRLKDKEVKEVSTECVQCYRCTESVVSISDVDQNRCSYTHDIITLYYIITQPMLSISNVVQIFRTYIVSVVQNDLLPIIYTCTRVRTKIFSDFYKLCVDRFVAA